MTASSSPTHPNPVVQVLRLCAIPTISMFLGSILVLFYKPGSKLTSAMQHFAAGVVFCAVSVELMPKIQTLSKNQGWQYTMAVAGGFCGGVAFLFVIGRYFTTVDEGDEEGDDTEKGTNGDDGVGSPRHLLSREPSSYSSYASINRVRSSSAPSSPMARGMTRKYASMYEKKQATIKALANRAWHDLQQSDFTIPWGMIAAVAVDGTMDGLLIGISFAAGGHAGFIMALALMIEMCFLGISTSIAMTSIKHSSRIVAAILCAILPGFILLGGVLGATVMTNTSGPFFVSLLAFGVAALLYLVVEELLIEAHDDPTADTWFVAIQFFAGFLLVVILEQYGGDDHQ